MRTPGRAVVAATAPSGPVLPARRRVFPVVVTEAATDRHEVTFGAVRETPLIPLYDRAAPRATARGRRGRPGSLGPRISSAYQEDLATPGRNPA